VSGDMVELALSDVFHPDIPSPTATLNGRSQYEFDYGRIYINSETFLVAYPNSLDPDKWKPR